MNILLIIPKYNYSVNPDFSYNFPLGLAYISSTLKKANYSVDCLNLNHLKGSVEELVTNALNKKKYDLVGSGGNAFLFSQLKTIVKTTHNHSSKPLFVMGGPIITSEPMLMFEALDTDFAVLGEGEETIKDLVNSIENKKPLLKVKGIIFKENGNSKMNEPREPIKDIEKIPYPDFDGIDFNLQLKNMHCNDNWNFQAFDFPRTYPILASRGCPFNCSFCWHDMRFRARSIKDVMKELRENVEKYNINNIMIYDDCFSANKDRLYEFCREIKKFSQELGRELKWHCQLIVNTVDPEMLKTMREAGCEMISYGFESFSPTVLKSMRKPITPEKIDFAFKETLKARIGIQGNFIFGDIAETKQTAKETLDYWKKNAQAQISLGFVEPYPGSDIYKHCVKKGLIKDKIDFIENKMGSDARINMTDSMTDEELKELDTALLILFSKHAKFVRPKYLKKTSKNIYSLSVKCPYCNQEVKYNNCFISNPLTYGLHLICRNCRMRFVLVSNIQRLAYRYYSKTRKLRDKLFRIKNKFKKMKIAHNPL